LHPDEQAILANWYNSLNSTEFLNWNIENDLCGQNLITCDDSSPYQSVISLYLSFFFFFFLKNKKHLENPQL